MPLPRGFEGHHRFCSARTLVGAERFDEASSDARDLCNAHAETRFFKRSRSAGLNALDPWRRDMGCIPQAEWRVRRVHGGCVRSLCRKPDQKRPVVCFDERPPIAELAPTDFGQSRPARALRIAITSATAPSVCSSSSTRTGPWRKVDITDSRAAVGFAACMRTLATVTSQRQSASGRCWTICPPTPSARFTKPSLPAEARRLLCRLAFHYVPKHASWLSMVEIGVLRSQCLDRRIQGTQRTVSEVAAWERQRNASRARIKWMFTTEKPRAKAGRAYTSRSSAQEA